MPAPTPVESDLEAFFRKRVRLLGGLTFKVMPTTAGMPDRVVFFPGGRIYFVELKRDGETPSRIQLEHHRRLRVVGTRVYVLAGREECLEWLRRITQYQDKARPKAGAKR